MPRAFPLLLLLLGSCGTAAAQQSVGWVERSGSVGWVERSEPHHLSSAALVAVLPQEESRRSDPAARRDVEQAAAKLVTPAADRAIQRGLKWLTAVQHDDGSFATGPLRGNAAICALAGMAYLSSGSTPGRGPYGAQVERCTRYILANVQPSGFISAGDTGHGPMYGHGFGTMYLAECDGMAPRLDIREKLAKAVKLIVNCQNKDGGWRYQPVVVEVADISVTVCQLVALRAARNAGLFVPNEVVDRAVGYLKRSQNPDGGFMYMLQGGGRESAFPRSAAAVAALYSAGIYRGPEIDKGLAYVMQFLPTEGAAPRASYYFYGHYYAAQAMWQAGGQRWLRWYPAIRDDLIARQRDDGSWTSPETNECATAMALLALEMPNNYLPIFQR